MSLTGTLWYAGAVALASVTKMYRAREDGRPLPVLLLAVVAASGEAPLFVVLFFFAAVGTVLRYLVRLSWSLPCLLTYQTVHFWELRDSLQSALRCQEVQSSDMKMYPFPLSHDSPLLPAWSLLLCERVDNTLIGRRANACVKCEAVGCSLCYLEERGLDFLAVFLYCWGCLGFWWHRQGSV